MKKSNLPFFRQQFCSEKLKHSIQTIITIYCYSVESCLFVRLLVCFMDDSVWIFPRALRWFLWSCDGLWVREVLAGLGLCQALSHRICVELGLETHLSPMDELFHLQSPITLSMLTVSLPQQSACSSLVHIPRVLHQKQGDFSHWFSCFGVPSEKQRLNYLWNKVKYNWKSKYSRN